jgi:hypothetical protein
MPNNNQAANNNQVAVTILLTLPVEALLLLAVRFLSLPLVALIVLLGSTGVLSKMAVSSFKLSKEIYQLQYYSKKEPLLL